MPNTAVDTDVLAADVRPPIAAGHFYYKGFPICQAKSLHPAGAGRDTRMSLDELGSR